LEERQALETMTHAPGRSALFRFVLLATLATAGAAAQMSPLAGDWAGALELPEAHLRLALHIQRLANGALQGTLDSPDEGIRGLRLDEVRLDLNLVRFHCNAIHTSFEGRLSGDAIHGTLRQRGFALPLTLQRGLSPAPARPQTPKPPFPYVSENVVFPNESARIRLAGTYTAPLNAHRVPAVVLISMSGAMDRDETIYDHKPFLLLADQLTRAGIAVLRWDRRGVGASQGNYAAATTADNASDAAAAVEYLRRRAEVDASKIGLLGHSEGGAIAPLLAAADERIAFLVLLAPPGEHGDALTLDQAAALKEAAGGTPEQGANEREWVAKLLAIVEQEPSSEAAAARSREQLAAWPDLDGWLAAVNNAWFRYFLSFDPAPALEQVKQPVLVIVGELDRQVAPAANLAAIEAALNRAHNRKVTVRLLPGLNHLLQTAATGAPREYGRIEETIAPVALETIVRWVRQQTGLEKKR
jgi:pimeloyl-ACP methyl ester carboxylesterase